jgi:uncharacterized protein (TIGR00661 family)
MARIVYSCCGEGRGHSSRTLTIARKLRALGHEVHVLASHAAHAALQPLIPNVTEIPGLVLVYDRNQVQFGQTIARNLVTWKKKKQAVNRIESLLREIRPDLAITDFEPFLPLAARSLGTPFISIDHQHVIPGLKLKTPTRYWGHFAATLAIVHLTHRGERANLVTSFFQPAKPFGPAYHYFGPILREEIAALRPSENNHVLVYQTSSSFARLPGLLRQLPFQFKIYAFDREGRDGNCTFLPRNHPDFLSDLASSSWVLTNGGYTLISESLFLGKPVLSVPVSGQFEQWINAFHLEKLGLGANCEPRALTQDFVNCFVRNLDVFRRKIGENRFDGTDAVLNKVLSFL